MVGTLLSVFYVLPLDWASCVASATILKLDPASWLLFDDLLKNSVTSFEKAEELFLSNSFGESYSTILPALIEYVV